MEAGSKVGQISEVKVWVLREPTAAELQKDENGPVQLEVMHTCTEQSSDKVCLCLFYCSFNHRFVFLF